MYLFGKIVLQCIVVFYKLEFIKAIVGFVKYVVFLFLFFKEQKLIFFEDKFLEMCHTVLLLNIYLVK